MPSSCPICGSEDFECESGLFYCSGCGTQSQQFVEEQLDSDYEVSAKEVAGKTLEKDKEEKRPEDKEEVSRPWMQTEGLTILLRYQVDALIKMGAAPQLKDVVFRLWASYLKKIGHGFGDTSHKVSSKFTRADFLPTSKQPKPIQNLLVNRQLKSKKKFQSVADLQAMHNMFGGEMFYDNEDNPFYVDEEEPNELDMYAEEREEWLQSLKEMKVHEHTYTASQKAHGYITVLHVTLSICYIALQYTNSLVILFDILRAAKTGRLPFSDAVSLFPPDMILTGKDWFCFCTPYIPKIERFHRSTRSICSLLDVFPLPAPDLGLLALRFLHDLNLPVDLHSLIRTLFAIQRPQLDKPDLLLKNDVLAMAYIIIATKLVFGLNDETEEKLTSFTEELTQLLGPNSEVKLFSWKNWLLEASRRRTKSDILPSNWRTVRTSVSTNPYCKELGKHTRFRSLKHGEKFVVIKNSREITAAFRQMCSNFESLDKLLSDTEEELQDGCLSSGHPAAVPSDDHGDHEGVTANNSSVTENAASGGDKDYTEYSVMHLTDWEGFADLVINGSPSEQSSKYSSHEGLQDGNRETLCKRLEKISEKRICAWSDYIFYQCFCDLDSCHKSYVYMLGAAEKIVGYSKDVLHLYVQSLELVYFKKQYDLPRRERLKRQIFIQLYF